MPFYSFSGKSGTVAHEGYWQASVSHHINAVNCAYYHPDIAGADFNDEIQPFGYAGVKKLFCDLEKALDRKGAEDK